MLSTVDASTIVYLKIGKILIFRVLEAQWIEFVLRMLGTNTGIV